MYTDTHTHIYRTDKAVGLLYSLKGQLTEYQERLAETRLNIARLFKRIKLSSSTFQWELRTLSGTLIPVYKWLFLLYLAWFSGVFFRNFFGLSRVYLGLRVQFCSYKWIQRIYLIFDIFIYPTSQVNHTIGEIVILGVRSLWRPTLLR